MNLQKYKISGKSIENIDVDEELYCLAESETMKIREKIDQSLQAVENAKELKRKFDNMKEPGFLDRFLSSVTFGVVGKDRIDFNSEKISVVAEALDITNDAVVNITDLIQESIKFSCQTLNFAMAMTVTISKMMEEGFKDRDGNMIGLTKVQKEIFRSIKSGAEQYIKFESWKEEISKEIVLLREQLEKNSSNILRIKKIGLFIAFFVLFIFVLFVGFLMW